MNASVPSLETPSRPPRGRRLLGGCSPACVWQARGGARSNLRMVLRLLYRLQTPRRGAPSVSASQHDQETQPPNQRTPLLLRAQVAPSSLVLLAGCILCPLKRCVARLPRPRVRTKNIGTQTSHRSDR
jgi:hypothetical protein